MPHRHLFGPRRREAARRRFLPTALGGAIQLENRALLATVTVTTTADTFDAPANVTVGTLGNGGPDGRISLREAVAAVTNSTGQQTVVLPAGTYNLTQATGEMLLGGSPGRTSPS